MRTLWVVLTVAACGGSSKPAMGPPPPPAKIADTAKPEPVEQAAPTTAPTTAPAPAAAPAPQVASDPEEGGQVASDPEEGGQVASAAGPGLDPRIGTAGGGGAGAGGGQSMRRTAAGVSVVPGKPTVSGDIDREAVKNVVRRHFNEIRYCYEKELHRNPSLNGRIEVVFTIDKAGKVPDAKATGVDDELDRCIESRFKTFVFPKVPDSVQITYPIMFTQQ